MHAALGILLEVADPLTSTHVSFMHLLGERSLHFFTVELLVGGALRLEMDTRNAELEKPKVVARSWNGVPAREELFT